jgi:hypothetical protein
MDRDLASHVIRMSFRSMSEITGLLPLLKAHCTHDEYVEYRNVIAGIAAEISRELMHKIFSLYPDLEDEVDQTIKKYDRLL